MPVDAAPQTETAAPAPTPSIAAGYRAIRFRSSTMGHLVVTGSVRGRPVEVLVDSGASATVIDRSWAAAAGLPLRPIKGQGFGAGGATLPLAEVDGVTLSVGGVALRGIGLIAMDLGSVRRGLARNNVAPPQVILGVDALRRWRAIIDFGTSTMWIAPAAGVAR